MRLQVQDGHRDGAVSISFRASATVSDLSSHLFADPSAALVIDGVVHLSDALLSDVALVEGSTVSLLSTRRSNRSGIGRAWVGVTGGPGAGGVRRLDSIGNVDIGRGPFNDLVLDNETVSEIHARLEQQPGGDFVVEDLGSLNGTWVNGKALRKPTNISAATPIRVGSSTIAARPVRTDDQPVGMGPRHADTSGRILVNRPPRSLVASGSGPIELPDQPAERTAPALTIVSMIVPLLFAGVMVAALGSWRYAIFGLLSPVMAIGNWLSGRRKVKREREGDVRTHRRALADLDAALTSWEATERARAAERGPDVLEVRRRIEHPSNRLWERRPTDDDALFVRLGMGTAAVAPETTFSGTTVPVDVARRVDGASPIEDVELLVSLREGPLGLVGDALMAAAAARSMLIHAATHHGPADYRFVILTSHGRLGDWRALQWLPHVSNSMGGADILTGDSAVAWATGLDEQLAGSSATAGGPNWLIVVDDVALLHQRSSPLRRLLEGRANSVFGVVLTRSADQLPASVTTVVQFDSADGTFSMSRPQHPGIVDSGILDTMSAVEANDLARQLARFEDPEQRLVGGSVPHTCTLADVYRSAPDAAFVNTQWRRSKAEAGLTATVGLTADGPFVLDLVTDGPHALIAGTTGAGKSELLRSLVAGLAASHDPDDLVFVLIDYKGGSAFDCCADLPHVVGVVTDLDDHLGERALLSLEAELRSRERQLRDDGSQDIAEYRQNGSRGGPLPRLVVMIDEFASLRTELPDFMSALIDIAQRGRSLGVHLVLATQRPSGAVDANIKANTNLRMALRVQDASDSVDVIGSPLASQIARTTPGRCYVRRGEGDVVPVQTLFLSGATSDDVPEVTVAHCVVGKGQPPVATSSVVQPASATALSHFVLAIVEAAGDAFEPKTPWLAPLASIVHAESLDELIIDDATDGSDVPVVVIDDPANQQRVARGWNSADGNLAVVGVLGSGVSTTLRSAIVALGAPNRDRAAWVFPVDCAAGALAGIDNYPHVAGVIDGADSVRQTRLLQYLSQTLNARREVTREERDRLPLIVVAIDGIASFAETNDLAGGTPASETWATLCRDGSSVGIVVLAGATRIGDLPRTMRPNVRQHIVLEQGMPSDYGDLGLGTRTLPTFTPGRCLMDGLVGQVVNWELAIGPSQCADGESPPTISALPAVVGRDMLADVETVVATNLAIPLGLDDTTRAVTRLTIRAGEHAVVAGPSGSGRTATLRLLSAQLRSADPDLILVAVAPRLPAPIIDGDIVDAGGTIDDLHYLLERAIDDDRRWVIVIDDADRIDMDSGPLVELAKGANPNVTIIGAVRSSTARQAYGHWTRFLRASGTGILLQPDNSADGELLGIRLPRHERLPALPGRGYLVVDANAHTIQVCS